MSYHETATHGKPSTAPPAKRSKQVAVRLIGGPRGGETVTYGQPLPKTLVLSSEQGWVDYHRKTGTTEYISAEDYRP